MRQLSLISSMVLALGTCLPGAALGVLALPAAVPVIAPSPEVSPIILPPIGLTSTRILTHPDDALTGDLVTTIIANPPIPDSPASRRLYGGPDSAAGRATAPQPGMATTVHPAPMPYGPQLPKTAPSPRAVIAPVLILTPSGQPPQ